MASSFREVLETYSEICIFVLQFNIQCPRNSQWEVLAEFVETFFDDKAHVIVNFHNFFQPLALLRHPLTPKLAISLPSPQTEQLPKFLSSRHIRNSLSVYLFLDSESQLGKSKGLIISRNFEYYILFVPSKAIRSRQALHEIIRTSSLSIIFIEYILHNFFIFIYFFYFP